MEFLVTCQIPIMMSAEPRNIIHVIGSCKKTTPQNAEQIVAIVLNVDILVTLILLQAYPTKRLAAILQNRQSIMSANKYSGFCNGSKYARTLPRSDIMDFMVKTTVFDSKIV